MKELEYPFYAEEIIKKRKSYKKFILSSNTGGFIDKRIAILGGRGTGKTSVMYSIREELQAATGVSKESSNDIILPILIPDNMKEESNIMGGICRARYNQCFVT